MWPSHAKSQRADFLTFWESPEDIYGINECLSFLTSAKSCVINHSNLLKHEHVSQLLQR
jgi:hypothetical protein